MNFRYFLTIYKTTGVRFITHLSVDEISERLDNLVHARTLFPMLKALTSKKEYTGDVSEQAFEFRKLQGYYKKTISRVVYGKINQLENHVAVDVKFMADSAVVYSLFLACTLFLTVDFATILIEAVVKLFTRSYALRAELLFLPVFWGVWVGFVYYSVYSYQNKLKAIIIDLEHVFEVHAEPVLSSPI